MASCGCYTPLAAAEATRTPHRQRCCAVCAELPPTAIPQVIASTALAYVNDKSELRPGDPNSTMHSLEDPAKLTHTKMRFHESSGAGSPGAGSSSAAALDALDDAPGARTKAQFGEMPRTKVSATHDSATKGPRFVQEDCQKYNRFVPECVEPDNIEDEYEEIPTPLPSPAESEAEN